MRRVHKETVLKRVSFEEALRDKKNKYVILGKIKEIEELNSPYTNQIQFKFPLRFRIINDAVKETYEGVDYIDFWGRARIYRVLSEKEMEIKNYEQSSDYRKYSLLC